MAPERARVQRSAFVFCRSVERVAPAGTNLSKDLCVSRYNVRCMRLNHAPNSRGIASEMALAFPIFAVFDSATLGKVSRDYWSQESACREKAKRFLGKLRDRGVHVALTWNHVSELLRHENVALARDRFGFLRAIPLIAWVRPYDRNWFPGGILDLLTRELHAVVNGPARTWRAIVDQVRPDVWETGTGSDMFAENENLWILAQSEGKRHHRNEIYVASVARTDPGEIFSIKLRDVLKWPERPKEERHEYMRLFVEQVKRQLDKHGDARFQAARVAAISLAINALKAIEAAEAETGDPIQLILERRGIPIELIDPEMTIGQIGELGIYAGQLKLLGGNLSPSRSIDMRDVPPDTLPSYAFERQLAAIQRKAERVSGSDLGDRHLAALGFYADVVEVDKRTSEYVRQVRRAHPNLDELLGRFAKSSDYMQIAGQCEAR